MEQEVKQSPQSVEEAVQGPHSEKWKKAMESEMDSLKENGVYEIVTMRKLNAEMGIWEMEGRNVKE